MGIYIEGMEMPYSCLACPLHSYNMCRKTGYDVTWEIARQTRRNDCPFIEIPDHGRLIDADAFKKYISVAFEKVAPELSGGYSWLAKQLTEDLIKDIDEAPTIIPAEPGEEET